MQPIPETGGGFSGFVAYWLWHLYQYFPSSGNWDWLLLFLLLGILVRLLYLPLLWKTVKSDMDCLKTGKMESSYASFGAMLWDIGCAFFLIWLFHTTAGQTFLGGRCGSPDTVARVLFWLSLIACLGLSNNIFPVEERHN